MANTNVWCVRYFAGNTGATFQDADSPQRRGRALRTAKQISNGWHVWVEHEKTGKRIYDNRDTNRQEGWSVIVPESAAAAPPAQKAGG